MSERKKFSDRHGYASTDAEITVRQEAPSELRGILPEIAYEAGLSPSPMRELVCRLLRKIPNPNNWSEYPNVAWEVGYLIGNCEWFEVYDIIEEVYELLSKRDEHSGKDTNECQSEYFSRELNKYFRRNGIGWQLVSGQLQIRGSEIFEDAVHRAKEALEPTARQTTNREIHQALLDLSRRPDPDVTGAIQHAMAALECVARDISSDTKSTLGELLKKHPGLFPTPLDQAIEKAWGYASERGRHLREGREPDLDEAELIVGLAAVLATYLVKKA